MLPLQEIETIAGTFVGAATLTLSAVKYLDKRKEKKYRVSVTLKHGWPAVNYQMLNIDLLLLEAANPGSQSVTLTSCGILLPDKKTLISRKDNGDSLPCEIAPGKSCTKWMETLDVTETLLRGGWRGEINLVGFYGDALGKKYKSRPLRVDLAMWQRIAAEKKADAGVTRPHSSP